MKPAAFGYAGRALLRNIAAGVRLALFLPVSRQAFRIDAVQLLLLFAVSSLVDIAGDRLRFGPDSLFNSQGAGNELAAIAMLALLALLVAITLRRPALALAITVTVMSTTLIVQVVHYLAYEVIGALPSLTAAQDVVEPLILAWIVAILVRCVAMHLEMPWRWRWLTAGLAALVLALPLVVSPMLVDAVPWFSSVDIGDDASGDITAASEPVLAAQKELLDNALSDLDDRDPGAPNLYFVAYAPDGNEVAWTSHMQRVRKLLDRRLDTEGHSIILRNHPDTMLSMPFATISNLRETFAEIAAAADPDQDILMLYIGGKGSRGGRIAGTLPPLDLVTLTPAGLKSLLDDAGFQWRIVVVAACYSGAYVDALDDDHTVVIAASAADRPSFGCEGRADPTFFGDALFAAGFAHGDSLVAAFETATRLVTARERERGLAASRPEIRVGSRIAPRVAHLRRFGTGGNVTDSGRLHTYRVAFGADRIR